MFLASNAYKLEKKRKNNNNTICFSCVIDPLLHYYYYYYWRINMTIVWIRIELQNTNYKLFILLSTRLYLFTDSWKCIINFSNWSEKKRKTFRQMFWLKGGWFLKCRWIPQRSHYLKWEKNTKLIKFYKNYWWTAGNDDDVFFQWRKIRFFKFFDFYFLFFFAYHEIDVGWGWSNENSMLFSHVFVEECLRWMQEEAQRTF